MFLSQLAILPRTECRLILKGAARFLQILSISLVFGLSNDLKAQVTVSNLTSLSESVVQAAINSALQGEEIQLPAGTATWTSLLVITNNISLVGAGAGNTVIIDGIPSASYNGLIQWNTVSNYTQCELSGFTFADTSSTPSHPDYIAEIQLLGYCPVCHVTSCFFQNLFDPGIIFGEGTYGCVDHCQFATTNFCNDILCYNGGLGGMPPGDALDAYGDVSWATPVQWGSVTNFIYIEACSFWFPNADNGAFSPAIDCISGSRVVFRYNTVTNMYFQSHGTESGGRERGGRAFELYDNYYVNNDPAWTNNGTTMGFRSGTGVIFSNTFVGFGPGALNLVDYRGSQGWNPFGGADGVNPWDSNGVVVATGTHTGPSGVYYLEDANANWTMDQWVGGYGSNTNWSYVCQDVTQGGATYSYTGSQPNYGPIISNGVHDIYLTGNHFAECVAWANGDKYAIYKVCAQIDQPGRGQGDLLADNAPYSGWPYDTVTGHTNWPNEALEPWYDWANTNDSVPLGFGSNIWYIAGGCEGSWPTIIEGRDYYDYTVKPGYTPLRFPHPLDTTNVTSTLPTFVLTVVNGTGGGNYTNGASVSILGNQVNTVTNGIFGFWNGSCIANTNSANTTVTMPASNLTVTAIYAPTPPPSLWAQPGS
jgi:hypothetical protein